MKISEKLPERWPNAELARFLFAGCGADRAYETNVGRLCDKHVTFMGHR
ncbi:MAG: hypothetical protein IH867_12980 [Chloroflexi bacterium]|nr:hypothetical protein [Chloroflexota bacterium]